MRKTKRTRTQELPHRCWLIINDACRQLREARDDLRRAGAAKAADYVGRALKSAEGAERHASRVLSEAQAAARGE